MSMTLTNYQIAMGALVGGSWAAPGTTTSTLVPNNSINRRFQTVLELANGTGTGNADTIIIQPRLLAASASETLNFFDGSVVDITGAATALQTIKNLIIYQIANADATTAASSFTVGGAASDVLQLNFGSTTDTWTGYKDQAIFWAGRNTGYTVDATHKNLKVLNNDGANKLSYLLIVAGNHV